MTITQADIDAAIEACRSFVKTSGAYYAEPKDGGHWLVQTFAAHREAAEARAKMVGSKAMQERRLFPVLGTRGAASVDWQFVADHSGQALKNHSQTVERLAERGGMGWCELCAVIEDRKWERMETAEAMLRVRAAEARYLATLDPAQIAAAEARAREEGAKAMREADAINRVARALYKCEKQRSDHVDRLLSAAKGQPVKFRMEHWDDVADIYRSDAVAAIAALDPAQIAGGGK